MKNLANSNVKVREVMTTNLVVVSLEATIRHVVKTMVDRNVECLLIVGSNKKLCGLVTFRDIITKVVYPNVIKGRWRRPHQALRTMNMKIKSIMTKNLITCGPDSTILDVVKIMKNKHLRRIPVVDVKNRLVGLVTDFDLSLFGWNLT